MGTGSDWTSMLLTRGMLGPSTVISGGGWTGVMACICVNMLAEVFMTAIGIMVVEFSCITSTRHSIRAMPQTGRRSLEFTTRAARRTQFK